MLLILALIVEAAVICPGWMEATNTWWLGSKNPTRFAFSTSNGEYRQNLKRLQEEVEARNLSPLFVVFPGTDPAWINAYVPSAQVLAPGDPTPPGWYAVSIVAEQYLPAFENADEDALLNPSQWKALASDYAAIRRSMERTEDHGYSAGTFHLFRLLNPKVQSPQPSRTSTMETP
jgi:hypothetical protein